MKTGDTIEFVRPIEGGTLTDSGKILRIYNGGSKRNGKRTRYLKVRSGDDKIFRVTMKSARAIEA